jgi:hypothetical protein
MGKQSKRQVFRTIRLHLEAVERRDLLSGMRSLVNLSVVAPSSPAPVVVQTSVLAEDSLTITTATFDSATNTTTSSSQNSDVQPPSSGTNGAASASAGSLGDTIAGSVNTLTPVVDPSTTAADTSSSSPLETAAAIGTSVALSESVPVAVDLVEVYTLAPLPTLGSSDSTGSQSGTAGSSDGQGDSSPSASSGSSVGASQDAGSQVSSVATVPIQSAAGSSSNDNYSEASSVSSLPSAVAATVSPTVSAIANAGNGTAPNGSAQSTMPVAANPTVVLAASKSVSSSAPVSSEGSSLRSTATDVRPPSSAIPPSSPVPSHGRGDNDITALPALSTATGLIPNYVPANGNPTGSDRSSSVSDDASVADHSSSPADLKSLVSAVARSASRVDMFCTDIVFAEQTQLGQGRPKMRDGGQPQGEEPVIVLCVGAGEEGTGSPVARGAGLLGSPLSFDVDALAREAQQFYKQIDQLSQDLATLLARMQLPHWSVAVAVVAAVAAVARRRWQQDPRSLVLEGCVGTAFICYPGLGGPWSWEESGGSTNVPRPARSR